MKIVHVQTIVQATFGVLDDEGNVVPQQPLNAQITKFTPELFTQAYDSIKQQRDEITERSEEAEREAERETERTNRAQRRARSAPKR